MRNLAVIAAAILLTGCTGTAEAHLRGETTPIKASGAVTNIDTTSKNTAIKENASKKDTRKKATRKKTTPRGAEVTSTWNKLYQRNNVTSTWSGGDGAVSFSEGKRTWWLFGDTLTRTPLGVQMDTSSMLYSPTAGQARNVTINGETNPATAFETVAAGKHWPTAAVRTGPSTFVVSAQDIAYTATDAWGFTLVGSVLYTFTVNGSEVTRSRPTPTPQTNTDTPIAWGAAMARDGDTTWIVGTQDVGQWGKHAYLASAPTATITNTNTWTYYSQGTPVPANEVTPLITADIGLPYHFSLHKQNGTWIIIAKQYEGIGDNVIALAAATPTGPWSAPKAVLNAAPRGGVMKYAAIAHPNLSTPTHLLVGVSVNDTSSLQAIIRNPRIYRPYFTAVPRTDLPTPPN